MRVHSATAIVQHNPTPEDRRVCLLPSTTASVYPTAQMLPDHTWTLLSTPLSASTSSDDISTVASSLYVAVLSSLADRHRK